MRGWSTAEAEKTRSVPIKTERVFNLLIFECLTEVFDEVIDILDSDRETDEVG